MGSRFCLGLSLAVLATAFGSQAKWVELGGMAEIHGQSIETARQQAISDALSKAGEYAPPAMDYQVSEYQLISEQMVRGKQIQVSLRANLLPLGQECDGAGYRVAITIPKAQIVHWEQLTAGSLYALDASVSRVLANTLNGEANSAFSHLRTDLTMDYQQLNRQYPGRWVQELSQKDRSQYVLGLTIDDVTIDGDANALSWMVTGPKRYFAMDATLYDGLKGQQVWQQRYRVEGRWPYKRTEAANIASSDFWNSDYGEEVRDLLNRVAVDVNTAVECRALVGTIQNISGRQLTINLGSQHGIKVGDKLAVNSRSITSNTSWQLPNNITDMATITHLYPEQAVATLEEESSFSAWQIQDEVRVIKR
ncbi:flagella assembly protein FlgT middle domain-containing protein [Ferrimonas aestuarii]|uniref:Flagellar assembly protein T, N-terminal domain n=1 Tax=Ferrimonas aestuarii TaxID=2569539 RepID=A0A4V5NYC4_9GAMM|nr:flagella assembly protein FlgT middle domain-containing protein [Ferrimonas aestuarii]TKB58208.1 hypothetical protein FCL42_00130 [Ferrimonas aestuarii]